MTQQINSQQDFENVKPQFKNASAYKKFLVSYNFNPKLRIRLTGIPIEEAIPISQKTRRKIFEKMQNMDGSLVSLVNSAAQTISKRGGETRATPDADIFIAVHKGFIELTGS
ncbi:MAG: hypothetical protein CL877_08755 [Dehalococcoidales bacterium]|jgi:hypothetical protein|nr:hypothetical protein [Dehalococcoidales bacterium]MDP6253214.1 hypothetical protein [Alphaproteobacteria bacterium]|tara:strand:+ start:103 stop:438 length:336 start_codon:yes stop_codon:yes gene_type:complete